MQSGFDQLNPWWFFCLLGSNSDEELLSKRVSFPMTDCQALSVEGANNRVKVLAYHLSRKLALALASRS